MYLNSVGMMNRRDPKERRHRMDYDFNNTTDEDDIEDDDDDDDDNRDSFSFNGTIVVTIIIMKAVESLKSIPTMESTTRTISRKG